MKWKAGENVKSHSSSVKKHAILNAMTLHFNRLTMTVTIPLVNCLFAT